MLCVYYDISERFLFQQLLYAIYVKSATTGEFFLGKELSMYIINVIRSAS